MDMKLKPMSAAPKDGTPIVAIFTMIDEGDFIKVIFWTVEGDGGYWDTVESQDYDENFFLGWVGAAEEVFKEITGEEA